MYPGIGLCIARMCPWLWASWQRTRAATLPPLLGGGGLYSHPPMTARSTSSVWIRTVEASPFRTWESRASEIILGKTAFFFFKLRVWSAYKTNAPVSEPVTKFWILSDFNPYQFQVTQVSFLLRIIWLKGQWPFLGIPNVYVWTEILGLCLDMWWN